MTISSDQQFLLIRNPLPSVTMEDGSLGWNYNVYNRSNRFNYKHIWSPPYNVQLCSWPTFYHLLAEPLQAAVWSSAGSALALVRQNNIFYMRSINHKMEEVTSSGTVGEIYHGVTDWLYRGK